MGVDLSPVDDLDLDREVLDFVNDTYCANCTHFTLQGPNDGTPFCTRWNDGTEVRPGWVCQEYRPQGLAPNEED